jgi:GT2 family glycosyltransferase
MIARTAASSSNAKPYAHIAAEKAIQDSLDRRKGEGQVQAGPSPGFYRVKYKILGNPKVSIIIPIEDKVKYLQKCIQAILKRTEYDHYEILIVDNQGREPQSFRYYDEIRSNRKVSVAKYDAPFNYSKINNYAVSLIDSEYIIFLNQDTEVISTEWLTAMLEHVQREEVGVAGGLLYYPNNTIRHAGVIIGIRGVAGYSYRHFSRTNLGYFNRARIIQNVSAVTGNCMMTKRSIFQKVGGFDESFTVAFGDIDFCLKVREKGSLIVYTPYAELYHRDSLHGGYESAPEKQLRVVKEVEYFQEKWKDALAKGDPYYNPNLTVDREDFSIRI